MLRSVAGLLALIACVACNGVGATSDAATALRDRLDRELCAAKTVEEATDMLKREQIEYFLNNDRKRLTAKRSFNQEKLVSSSVVIEIRLEGQTISQCKVQVLHTGP